MANLTAKNSPGKQRIFYGYIIVIASFCSMAIMWGTFHAFGIFFNPMSDEFGWSRAATSGAFSLSLLVSGVSAIFMGRLTDKLGGRWVLTLCGFLAGLGYLLISRITAVWQLYLIYGIMVGIAMGGAWVPLMSSVARWFTARRSLMTGIVLSGLGVGSLIGPPLANWLVSIFKWRVSYIVIGVVALVITILAAQFLRRAPAQIGEKTGLETEANGQDASLQSTGLTLSEAVRTLTFWLFTLALFCFGFSLYTMMVHITPHAIDLGISETSAANILAVIGGLGILGMVGLGSLADKIGNRWGYIIGLLLMALPLLGLMALTGEWQLYLLTAIFGFGHGGFSSSESPLAAKLFGLKSHGTILGMAVLGFSIGAAAGPVFTGFIFDVTSGYQMAFLAGAIVCIIGIISSTLLRAPAKRSGEYEWTKKVLDNSVPQWRR